MTNDGSDPNSSATADTLFRITSAFVSPSQTAPFPLSSGGTYRATAQRLSFDNSEIASETYTFICGAPTPSLPPGNYPDSPDFEIELFSTTDSASIFYTTDGSTPTSDSTPFSGIVSLPDNDVTTIKAIATRSGFEPSPEVALFYDTRTAPTPIEPAITTPLEDITVDAGVQVVFLSNASGEPAPSYSWEFGTNQLPFFGNEYVIPNAQPIHSGTYTMTATNTIGLISTSAVLTVTPSTESTLYITSVQRSPSGEAIEITFPSISGTTYQIQTSTTATTGSWSPHGTTTGSGSALEYSIPIPSDTPVLLIRVRETR